MSDLGQAASKIGEKIVDILDVFDLSFFISGAVGIGAAMMTFPDESKELLGLSSSEGETSGAVIFGLVLGTYVVGLITFAMGRPLRDWLFERVRTGEPTKPKTGNARPGHVVFHDAALLHCNKDPELAGHFGRYFAYDIAEPDETVRRRAYDAAYTRMWAHLRSYERLQESFNLVKRYWTLAATYDGLAMALVLWWVPTIRFVVDQTDPGPIVLAIGFALLLPVLAGFCVHRARIYKRYQIEEIVATTAHWFALVGRAELPSGGAASDEASGQAS